MTTMIQQLHTDHENTARLLGLIEAELGVIQRGEPPDYVLLADTMQYMKNYLDLFHHSMENPLFLQVAEYDDSLRAQVTDLIRDHERFAARGAALSDSLHTVLNGHLLDRDELETNLHEYVALMRKHMRMEARVIFPVLEKMLNETDCSTIEQAMGTLEDPLFGRVVKAEYQALYDHISTSKQ